MLKFAFMASFLLGLVASATEPGRTVTFGRTYGAQAVPALDKGYLLFTDRANGVEVWAPDGQLVFQTAVINPPTAHVMSAAIDRDGTVAVGVAYSAGKGFAGGIAFLDRSGKQVRFVDTERYMPSHICFDLSHSVLWTFGWQRDSLQNGSEDSEDYLMFRKFSLEGQQLGAYAKRSLFPKPGLSPGGPVGGLWRLRVSADRVGALAYSGQTGGSSDWIELDLAGKLIGHWKLGSDTNGGTAFTSASRLCRQTFRDKTPRVECFDRNTQAWKLASNLTITDENGRALGILLGADGDNLVFGEGNGNIRLSWVRMPEQ